MKRYYFFCNERQPNELFRNWKIFRNLRDFFGRPILIKSKAHLLPHPPPYQAVASVSKSSFCRSSRATGTATGIAGGSGSTPGIAWHRTKTATARITISWNKINNRKLVKVKFGHIL